MPPYSDAPVPVIGLIEIEAEEGENNWNASQGEQSADAQEQQAPPKIQNTSDNRVNSNDNCGNDDQLSVFSLKSKASLTVDSVQRWLGVTRRRRVWNFCKLTLWLLVGILVLKALTVALGLWLAARSASLIIPQKVHVRGLCQEWAEVDVELTLVPVWFLGACDLKVESLHPPTSFSSVSSASSLGISENGKGIHAELFLEIPPGIQERLPRPLQLSDHSAGHHTHNSQLGETSVGRNLLFLGALEVPPFEVPRASGPRSISLPLPLRLKFNNGDDGVDWAALASAFSNHFLADHRQQSGQNANQITFHAEVSFRVSSGALWFPVRVERKAMRLHKTFDVSHLVNIINTAYEALNLASVQGFSGLGEQIAASGLLNTLVPFVSGVQANAAAPSGTNTRGDSILFLDSLEFLTAQEAINKGGESGNPSNFLMQAVARLSYPRHLLPAWLRIDLPALQFDIRAAQKATSLSDSAGLEHNEAAAVLAQIVTEGHTFISGRAWTDTIPSAASGENRDIFSVHLRIPNSTSLPAHHPPNNNYYGSQNGSADGMTCFLEHLRDWFIANHGLLDGSSMETTNLPHEPPNREIYLSFRGSDLATAPLGFSKCSRCALQRLVKNAVSLEMSLNRLLQVSSLLNALVSQSSPEDTPISLLATNALSGAGEAFSVGLVGYDRETGALQIRAQVFVSFLSRSLFAFNYDKLRGQLPTAAFKVLLTHHSGLHAHTTLATITVKHIMSRASMDGFASGSTNSSIDFLVSVAEVDLRRVVQVGHMMHELRKISNRTTTIPLNSLQSGVPCRSNARSASSLPPALMDFKSIVVTAVDGHQHLTVNNILSRLIQVFAVEVPLDGSGRLLFAQTQQFLPQALTSLINLSAANDASNDQKNEPLSSNELAKHTVNLNLHSSQHTLEAEGVIKFNNIPTSLTNRALRPRVKLFWEPIYLSVLPVLNGTNSNSETTNTELLHFNLHPGMTHIFLGPISPLVSVHGGELRFTVGMHSEDSSFKTDRENNPNNPNPNSINENTKNNDLIEAWKRFLLHWYHEPLYTRFKLAGRIGRTEPSSTNISSSSKSINEMLLLEACLPPRTRYLPLSPSGDWERSPTQQALQDYIMSVVQSKMKFVGLSHAAIKVLLEMHRVGRCPPLNLPQENLNPATALNNISLNNARASSVITVSIDLPKVCANVVNPGPPTTSTATGANKQNSHSPTRTAGGPKPMVQVTLQPMVIQLTLVNGQLCDIQTSLRPDGSSTTTDVTQEDQLYQRHHRRRLKNLLPLSISVLSLEHLINAYQEITQKDAWTIRVGLAPREAFHDSTPQDQGLTNLSSQPVNEEPGSHEIQDTLLNVFINDLGQLFPLEMHLVTPEKSERPPVQSLFVLEPAVCEVVPVNSCPSITNGQQLLQGYVKLKLPAPCLHRYQGDLAGVLQAQSVPHADLIPNLHANGESDEVDDDELTSLLSMQWGDTYISASVAGAIHLRLFLSQGQLGTRLGIPSVNSNTNNSLRNGGSGPFTSSQVSLHFALEVEGQDWTSGHLKSLLALLTAEMSTTELKRDDGEDHAEGVARSIRAFFAANGQESWGRRGEVDLAVLVTSYDPLRERPFGMTAPGPSRAWRDAHFWTLNNNPDSSPLLNTNAMDERAQNINDNVYIDGKAEDYKVRSGIRLSTILRLASLTWHRWSASVARNEVPLEELAAEHMRTTMVKPFWFLSLKMAPLHVTNYPFQQQPPTVLPCLLPRMCPNPLGSEPSQGTLTLNSNFSCNFLGSKGLAPGLALNATLHHLAGHLAEVIGQGLATLIHKLSLASYPSHVLISFKVKEPLILAPTLNGIDVAEMIVQPVCIHRLTRLKYPVASEPPDHFFLNPDGRLPYAPLMNAIPPKYRRHLRRLRLSQSQKSPDAFTVVFHCYFDKARLAEVQRLLGPLSIDPIKGPDWGSSPEYPYHTRGSDSIGWFPLLHVPLYTALSTERTHIVTLASSLLAALIPEMGVGSLPSFGWYYQNPLDRPKQPMHDPPHPRPTVSILRVRRECTFLGTLIEAELPSLSVYFPMPNMSITVDSLCIEIRYADIPFARIRPSQQMRQKQALSPSRAGFVLSSLSLTDPGIAPLMAPMDQGEPKGKKYLPFPLFIQVSMTGFNNSEQGGADVDKAMSLFYEMTEGVLLGRPLPLSPHTFEAHIYINHQETTDGQNVMGGAPVPGTGTHWIMPIALPARNVTFGRVELGPLDALFRTEILGNIINGALLDTHPVTAVKNLTWQGWQALLRAIKGHFGLGLSFYNDTENTVIPNHQSDRGETAAAREAMAKVFQSHRKGSFKHRAQDSQVYISDSEPDDSEEEKHYLEPMENSAQPNASLVGGGRGIASSFISWASRLLSTSRASQQDPGVNSINEEDEELPDDNDHENKYYSNLPESKATEDKKAVTVEYEEDEDGLIPQSDVFQTPSQERKTEDNRDAGDGVKMVSLQDLLLQNKGIGMNELKGRSGRKCSPRKVAPGDGPKEPIPPHPLAKSFDEAGDAKSNEQHTDDASVSENKEQAQDQETGDPAKEQNDTEDDSQDVSMSDEEQEEVRFYTPPPHSLQSALAQAKISQAAEETKDKEKEKRGEEKEKVARQKHPANNILPQDRPPQQEHQQQRLSPSFLHNWVSAVPGHIAGMVEAHAVPFLQWLMDYVQACTQHDLDLRNPSRYGVNVRAVAVTAGVVPPVVARPPSTHPLGPICAGSGPVLLALADPAWQAQVIQQFFATKASDAILQHDYCAIKPADGGTQIGNPESLPFHWNTLVNLLFEEMSSSLPSVVDSAIANSHKKQWSALHVAADGGMRLGDV